MPMRSLIVMQAGIDASPLLAVRIKSFQPSRDPILLETGLGQRAGRFPVCAFATQPALHSQHGRNFLGALHRASNAL